MAKIYFDLIVAGRKTFDQVPARLKEAVKQLLIEAGLWEG